MSHLITSGPSLQFANGSNTGLSSPQDDTLFFGVNGEERVNIDSTDMFVSATLAAAAPLYLTSFLCQQSVQTHVPAATTSSVTVNPGVTVLFINYTTSSNRTVNITLPPNPIDGQLLTILSNINSTNRFINLTYIAGEGGATVDAATDVTRLNSRVTPTGTQNGASVTYIYLAATNTWYKFRRG